MTIVLSTQPYGQYYDANGDPLSGGLIYTYLAGTLTPRATYTDQGGLTPSANPIVLDSAGRAEFWLDSSASYKIIVKDSLGTTIHTTDNIAPFSTATGLAVLGTIAANTIVGNNTGSAATPSALTVAQVLTMLSTSLQTGFKNFVINGNFQYWQRSTTLTLGVSSVYGSADRWKFYCGEATGGIANQDTSIQGQSLPFEYCVKWGRSSTKTSTGEVAALQGLESHNVFPMAGQTVTLSYYAKKGADYSSAASILGCAVFTGTVADEGMALLGSWTGQVTALNTNDTLTTSFQRFQHSFTVASGAKELAIKFYWNGVGTASTDDNVYMTGVQLEIGSSASSFDQQTIEQQVAQCSYYYEKSFSYGTAPAQNAGNTGAITVLLPTGASGTFGQSIQLLPKRVAPAIVTYNPGAANANWRDTTGGADRVVTVGTIGEKSFSISGAAGVAGTTNRIHFAADSEL